MSREEQEVRIERAKKIAHAVTDGDRAVLQAAKAEDQEKKRRHHAEKEKALDAATAKAFAENLCGVVKIGYADPPYINCAYSHYKDQPDYAGEVDHVALIERSESEFDGWVLHTSATPVAIAVLAPLVLKPNARWCAWVKGFAAFKPHVPVAHAWEPVIIKAARKPVVSSRLVMRDWIDCPITMQRGLTGAKPEAVCHWAFELMGARPEDELNDLVPGTGAVSKAWRTWQRELMRRLDTSKRKRQRKT